ncbi:MAG: LysE/ArgO family amino acid transporter [Granulosicoccus sp.]
MLTVLKGAGLGASLIIAIGVQNAFVLSQALRGNFALTIALVCALVDAILIALGVWGLGAFIERQPALLTAITLSGAAFLFIYGILAFRRALSPGQLDANSQQTFASRGSAVLTTLALSLLNPHVYLDTVLLLGSIGGQLPGREPLLFAIGAIGASFGWFFALATGGKVLAPVLSSARQWQRLDALIGIIMWAIAWSLLRRYILST